MASVALKSAVPAEPLPVVPAAYNCMAAPTIGTLPAIAFPPKLTPETPLPPGDTGDVGVLGVVGEVGVTGITGGTTIVVRLPPQPMRHQQRTPPVMAGKADCKEIGRSFNGRTDSETVPSLTAVRLS